MSNHQLEADFRLVACDRAGRPCSPLATMPGPIIDACAATAELYERLGFHPPWIGYVALADRVAVGGGAFVGPPGNGRVEIAYFILDEHQGKGFATRTARELVTIARAAEPEIEVFAKTAPEPNASTAVLSRLGFEMIGTTTDDEVGNAWAWLLR